MTRPTSALVREAIFNRIGQWLSGEVVDLCAGSGALGFEALSRGAASCTFVDRAAAASRAIGANAAALGLSERTAIVVADAARWARTHQGRIAAAEVCFVDPPYRDEELTRGIAASCAAARPRWLVVEHHAAVALDLGPGAVTRTTRYGGTAVTIAEWPTQQ